MVGSKTDWDAAQSTRIVHAMSIPSCISVLHSEPLQPSDYSFSKGPATKIRLTQENGFLAPRDMHRKDWSHDEFLRAQPPVPSQALLPLHGEVSWAATWQTQCRRLWPQLSVPKRTRKCTTWKHWSQPKKCSGVLGRQAPMKTAPTIRNAIARLNWNSVSTISSDQNHIFHFNVALKF